MADVRVPKSPKGPKKAQASKKPRRIYTLTPDELHEYQNRHRLMLSKQMEFYAASNYMDIFQNALMEEHKLPIRFNLNIETGVVTEVDTEGDGTSAQNGSV